MALRRPLPIRAIDGTPLAATIHANEAPEAGLWEVARRDQRLGVVEFVEHALALGTRPLRIEIESVHPVRLGRDDGAVGQVAEDETSFTAGAEDEAGVAGRVARRRYSSERATDLVLALEGV